MALTVRSGVLSVVAFTLLYAGPALAAAPKVYITAANLIFHADFESGAIARLYTANPDAWPDSIVADDEYLYWTTFYPGYVMRSDLDGSNPTAIVDRGSDITDGLQLFEGRIYWASRVPGAIYSATTDGETVQRILTTRQPYDLKIYEDRLYWTTRGESNIFTSRIDGSGYRVMPIPGGAHAYAIEVSNDRIYVSDNPDNVNGATPRILR